MNTATRAVQIVCVLALTACGHDSAAPQAEIPPTTAASFELTASVQELMEAMVDPHADVIWDAVGSTITMEGTQNKQPSNDDEWRQIRLSAIALMETTNLLAMNGRRLVPEGGRILDEGSEGVLTTEEAQRKLESQHETFAQFAHALRDVGKKVLRAVDAKDPNALLDAGTDLDEVCEGCHTTFWYPGQVLPNPADLLPK